MDSVKWTELDDDDEELLLKIRKRKVDDDY